MAAHALNPDSIIEVNGLRFIECTSGNPAMPHLFGDVPANCAGVFRRLSRRVVFYIGGLYVACLNRHGVLCRVSKLPDGRAWYSFGDPDGMGPVSYSESCRIRDALGTIAGWDKGYPVYSYTSKAVHA